MPYFYFLYQDAKKMTHKNQIPEDFSDESRVWIYQSNRPFRPNEIEEMDEQLKNFYLQWQSHGSQVKGWANILFDRFVVVIADEDKTNVGGCSTDSMVRIIKSFERQYQIELFDRMTIAFLVNEKVEPLPLNQIKYGLERGILKEDTLLFNNLVTTKKAFLDEWLVPLNESWLAAKVLK
jgi:hypothetical protein